MLIGFVLGDIPTLCIQHAVLNRSVMCGVENKRNSGSRLKTSHRVLPGDETAALLRAAGFTWTVNATTRYYSIGRATKREALCGASEETGLGVIGVEVDSLAVLHLVEAEECRAHHQILTRV